MELDDKVALPGAEGIDLDLVLAGIASRGMALTIDLAIQLAGIFALGLVLPNFGNVGVAAFFVLTFLLFFGYPIAMHAFAGGQTIGKRAMGITVVTTSGTPIGFLAATIRTVIQVIDALPGVFTVGLISMFATSRTQRLGDLAAGTLVVRSPKLRTVTTGPVAFAPGVATAPVLPPEIAHWELSAVSLDELAAVRSFLERRYELAPEARAQIGYALAEQLRPKVAGIPFDGYPELFLERVVYARSFR